MKKLFLAMAVLAALICFDSCSKKQGCTDPAASNYSASAEEDDGSCYGVSKMLIGSFSGNSKDSSSAGVTVNGSQTCNIVTDGLTKVIITEGGTTFTANVYQDPNNSDNYVLDFPAQNIMIGGQSFVLNNDPNFNGGAVGGIYFANTQNLFYSFRVNQGSFDFYHFYNGTKQ